jgi:hypothetical protein
MKINLKVDLYYTLKNFATVVIQYHLSSSTGVGLFADDTKLYKAVQNPSDALVCKKIYSISNPGQRKTD